MFSGMATSGFGTVAVIALQLIVGTFAGGDAPAAMSTAGPVTLASLKPPILQVNLRFNISGQVQPQDNTCLSDTINSPCLLQVQAAKDSVLIHYSVLPSATLPQQATNITIQACYSNFSQIDRAWRKSNPLISKDKSCPFKILPAPGKLAFSPLGGNATWKVPATVPVGTYYIRVYAMCKTPTGLSPCGLGQSLPGFFQVNKINSTPAGLVGGTIGAMFLGPFTLFAYFCYERMSRKTA